VFESAAIAGFVAGPRMQALFVLSMSTIFLRTSTAPRGPGLVGDAFGVALFVIPVIARPVGMGFPIGSSSPASPCF
jgi:hypothetical protein